MPHTPPVTIAVKHCVWGEFLPVSGCSLRVQYGQKPDVCTILLLHYSPTHILKDFSCFHLFSRCQSKNGRSDLRKTILKNLFDCHMQLKGVLMDKFISKPNLLTHVFYWKAASLTRPVVSPTWSATWPRTSVRPAGSPTCPTWLRRVSGRWWLPGLWRLP